MPKSDYGDFSQSPQPGELSDREVFGPWSDEEVFGDPREWRVENPRSWGAEPLDPRAWGAEPLEDGAHSLSGWDEVAPGEFYVPAPFLDRVRRGEAVRRIIDRAFASGKEGYGPAPLGIPVEDLNRLQELGIFANPHTGRAGYVSVLGEAAIDATYNNVENLMRMLRAGVYGAGGVFGQLIEELTGSELQGTKAEREAINFVNWKMVDTGMAHYARPEIGADQVVRLQPIGGLPTKWDFRNAADALGLPTDAPLREMWQEKGIHPAEAVQNAAQDAFLHDELRAAAGAEVTAPENLPTPEVQPLPPPNTLLTKLRNAGNEMLGLGRNFQFLLDPMATGSKRSMVQAKDFENTVYRIDWEWTRQDQDLVNRFDHEQRLRMFNAMDEESVALQKGESREHQGLVTLTDEERAAVEDLDARQQAAWIAARDLGMVEGDGLPMHATRYVMNIANADGAGGLALDTIGRNLTVRTGQMLHRKYLTVEETEAAAKALVRERLEKAGASPEAIAAAVEKVEVARDIRAVALSTAKLQKAIAGRTLINSIREIGESAGDTLVHEGEPPVEGWGFNLNHPAMKTWRPKVRFEDGVPSIVKDADGNTVFEAVPLYISNEFKGPLMSILEQPTSKHPLAQGAQTTYQAYMTLKSKAMSVIMNSFLIHDAVVWGKVAPSAPGQWAGFKLYFTGNRIVNDPVRSRQLVERGLAPIGHRGIFQDINSVMEEPNLRPGRSWTSQVLSAVPDLFSDTAGDTVRRAIDRAGDFWHNTLLWDRVRDVQFGLADHLSRNLQHSGLDAVAADRVGSYFANAIVGSIPKSAMSTGARQIANVMLFSRSFTLGNWQVIKTATLGLPKPILAQLERDLGVSLGEAGAEAAVKKLGRGVALGTASRMALAIIAIDYVIFKAVNSLIQNAANVAVNDSNWDAEFAGYAQRLRDEMRKDTADPFSLLNPLNFNENALGLPSRLSSTWGNEPGKQNRIHVGYAPDGTALYVRNPMGKYPEEITDWFTGPFDEMRRKLSPAIGAMLDVVFNNKGFGHRVYDETAETTAGQAANFFKVIEHVIAKHGPEMQISGGYDLLMGEGDQKTNFLRTFAPMVGFTVSQGYPGGPAKGIVAASRRAYEAKFDLAWPQIRKQIRNGNTENAIAAMDELKVTPMQKRQLLRAATNPAFISGRSVREFIYRSSPEEQEKFYRALQ